MFEYSTKIARPIAIVKMTSRFLEQQSFHKFGHLAKKSEQNNKTQDSNICQRSAILQMRLGKEQI